MRYLAIESRAIARKGFALASMCVRDERAWRVDVTYVIFRTDLLCLIFYILAVLIL